MAEIEWQKLSSRQFEDMVAVLLSHINPRVRRIDGAGGDGGRDAEFPGEGGLEIFELKSFTGRLNGSRRRQVERSLERAGNRNPVAWHLVVPIDPTPKEHEWFDKLGAPFDFPLSWKGRTWLNGQMAERPFIARYFLEGDSDRVIEMLTQLRQEQAALTNIQDGMARLTALADKINEMDPFYRFDVDIRGGDVTVVIVPRYEGAERDRPLSIRLGLRFPDTKEGHAAAEDFQAAMDFGSPVELESDYIHSLTLDAPVGFGGMFPEGGALKIGPPQPAEEWELKLVLRAVTVEGVPVATLPITLTERMSGRRGLIVKGSDPPGSFHIEMRVNIETKYVNLHFSFSSTADHYPHDLLPALIFMRGAQPSNKVQLLVGDDQVPLGDSVEVRDLIPIEEEYVRLVQDLASVQRETGTFFLMPAEFSNRDLRELAEAVDLLKGKEVTQEWNEGSFELEVANPHRFIQEMESVAKKGAFLVEGDAEATIAGHVVPLGRMRTHLPDARITNLDELRQKVKVERGVSEEDLLVRVKLEAVGAKTARMSLIPG